MKKITLYLLSLMVLLAVIPIVQAGGYARTYRSYTPSYVPSYGYRTAYYSAPVCSSYSAASYCAPAYAPAYSYASPSYCYSPAGWAYVPGYGRRWFPAGSYWLNQSTGYYHLQGYGVHYGYANSRYAVEVPDPSPTFVSFEPRQFTPPVAPVVIIQAPSVGGAPTASAPAPTSFAPTATVPTTPAPRGDVAPSTPSSSTASATVTLSTSDIRDLTDAIKGLNGKLTSLDDRMKILEKKVNVFTTPPPMPKEKE